MFNRVSLLQHEVCMYMCVCVLVCVPVCTGVYAGVCAGVCIYTCIWFVCVYVCARVNVCVCWAITYVQTFSVFIDLLCFKSHQSSIQPYMDYIKFQEPLLWHKQN